jgi:hypothetical protein
MVLTVLWADRLKFWCMPGVVVFGGSWFSTAIATASIWIAEDAGCNVAEEETHCRKTAGDDYEVRFDEAA